MRPPALSALLLALLLACAAGDHYDTLGVAQMASTEEIRKAYKRLALKYHPDKNKGDATAQQTFMAINDAHETLSDARKRRKYDQEQVWERQERGYGRRAYGGGGYHAYHSSANARFYRSRGSGAGGDDGGVLSSVFLALGALWLFSRTLLPKLVDFLQPPATPQEQRRRQQQQQQAPRQAPRPRAGPSATTGHASVAPTEPLARDAYMYAPAWQRYRRACVQRERARKIVFVPQEATKAQWRALQGVALKFRSDKKLLLLWADVSRESSTAAAWREFAAPFADRPIVLLAFNVSGSKVAAYDGEDREEAIEAWVSRLVGGEIGGEGYEGSLP